MCGESAHADQKEDALHGIEYHIVDGGHLGTHFATLCREGMGRPEGSALAPVKRAACVRVDTPVLLQNIPRRLQKECAIGGYTHATLIVKPLPLGMQVELPNGRWYSLLKFAGQDIRLQIAEPEQRLRASTLPPAEARQLEESYA